MVRVSGNCWSQGFHASRYSLPKLHTLPRRYTEQVRGTPNYIFLKFVYASIRVNHFPHHLNDPATPFVVKGFIEFPGKAIEIDRGARDRFGVDDQPGGRGIAESVIRSQDDRQFGPPALR
jgi:hypothetical protein